ncbi:lipopolysaccharide biosynthesis protein [Ornithinimicrobium sp. LYQ121]|uniref:lipopolysaccharide biosynthesis protein n=1 Tax=Ornithinimicrobium sp. LYQ121 TaxID=3378801 RepID=UPI0038543243
MNRVRNLLIRVTGGRVGRATAWSYASVGLSTFVGVFSARILLPEGRGHLALILTMAGMAALISALGTNISIRRLLPQDPDVSIAGYWRTSRYLLLVLLPLLCGSFIVLAALTEVPSRPVIFAMFLSYGIMIYWSNQSLDLMYALGLPVQATRTNAIGTAVTLCSIVTCALIDAGLMGVGLAYALGAATNVCVSRMTVGRAAVSDSRPAQGERRLVAQGSRLMGMTLGQVLATRADTVILGAMAPPAQVGYYAVSVSPAGLLRLPAAALGQVIMHDAASGQVSRKVAFKRTGVIWVASVVPAAVGVAGAPWILPFIYGPSFAGAVPAFQVLLIAEMCFIPFLVLSRVVAARGDSLGASAAGLIGVVVLVVAAIALIPGRGALGAAWASALAYFSMSLTACYFAARNPGSENRGIGPPK